MTKKLKALDLFCGAGGASHGLMDAGFHVTGVDIKMDWLHLSLPAAKTPRVPTGAVAPPDRSPSRFPRGGSHDD